MHGGTQTLLYTWDQYYWAANVLLAELTDGGTFHERAQFFMQQWLCGYGKLVSHFCLAARSTPASACRQPLSCMHLLHWPHSLGCSMAA
jgi:hypothetical protein